MSRSTFHSSSVIFQIVCLATLCAGASAQTTNSAVQSLKPIAQQNRVPASPNFSAKKQLSGHLPAWANANREVANHAVDQTSPMQLAITLQRDPAVQAAFEQLLADQQNPGSPMYHQWLTSTQIGQMYGPTQNDTDAVVSWLTAQGLTVTNVAPSRMLINAEGSRANVASAFQTSFAYYTLGQNERISARTEPVVPQALAPVIGAIGGLAQIFSEPMSHLQPVLNPERYQKNAPGSILPEYTSNPGSSYYMAAGDFETIYDMDSVVTGGNTGATVGSTTYANCPVTTAQCVAIIGRSQVTTADITSYMTNFGAHSQSSYHLTQTQVPTGSGGVTIGITYNADDSEATLDVQRVVGTANGAQAVLVYSGSGSSDGITAAINYNVNTLMYPVMTISFGSCEANSSAAAESAYSTVFAQAAGEGISTFVSAGDSAAAGCDADFTNPPGTTQFRSANQLCGSGYVTCVGGTEFADASAYTTYWNNSNSTGGVSAKGYIPEGAWNEPGSSGNYQVAGTGGGVSIYTLKPSFQTGTGVPADNYRDTPDVAFSAAQHDAYLGYYTASNGGTQGLTGFAGTSAAAPGMAGIAAMLNTKLAAAQGNLNPLIYHLAATSASAFHDVTVASSGVGTCVAGTPSMCNNSTPLSATSLTGGLTGYTVNAGYDQATGWGSLDVANFFTAAATLASGIDLTVTSTHTGNFKAGDTGDTYTLAVKNSGATSSSGTITVVDTLPSGFTATAMSGTNWSCTVGTLTCTSSTAIAGNTSGNAITLTVNVLSSDAGTYANSVSVSGGGATGTISSVDETSVIVPPTLTIAFSPASIAANGTSTLTFTFSNPSTNAVSLTGVAFTNTLPAGLTSGTPTAACASGSSYTYGYNSTVAQISAGTLAANSYCTYTVTVTAGSGPNYTDTTSTITTTNSNAGTAASATLYVQIAPAITWTPSSNTGYINTAIGSGVLDASAGAVAGTFVYTATNSSNSTVGIASNVTLPAGTYTLTASFTPSNTSQYTSAVSTISFKVVDQEIFVILSGGNAASFFGNGTTQSSATSGGGIGATINPNGYVFSINSNGAGVSIFQWTGVFTSSITGAGISNAKALATDGNAYVWIANGNGTVTALTGAGVAALTTPIDPAGGTAAPASISVDTAGSLWLAIPNTTTPSSSTVVEVIGSAAPISTPTVTQVINSTTGTKP